MELHENHNRIGEIFSLYYRLDSIVSKRIREAKKKNQWYEKAINLFVGWLLFYGITTLVGYLMLNPVFIDIWFIS